ncbi:MAG: HEAT repeat domain-containing protein [Planctomycetota bacterium]
MEEKLTLDALLDRIQNDDPNVRTEAWQAAGSVGCAAIKPLAKIVAGGELEVARAAKRAMWKIVHTVGAPGAGDAKGAVEADLIGLLGNDQPASVRREAFWMLSEIGGDDTVDAIRELPDILEDTEVREDARCCVERIPTEAAVEALKEGLEDAPPEFALAIAQSLRARGVEVDQAKYPCQKLVPTKQTSVKPVPK